MTASAEIARETARLQSVFASAGAKVVETDLLQPADVLLDLYGEDIRGRAFVTHDPDLGEMMLRPDFTVPVVQMHMADRAEPARYTYAGKVFRSQQSGSGRAREYVQVGYELFDGSAPLSADAEVFSLVSQALDGLGLRAVTGDLGVLSAAVRGLNTTERRKSALLRHIWRPNRFRALLDRFAGRCPVPETRASLIAEADPMQRAKPIIGLRSTDEISDRLNALRQDMAEPPISGAEMSALDALLNIRSPSQKALGELNEVARALPQLNPAIDAVSRRFDALASSGIDVDTLVFEAAYGRASMEYYDGFVFGFYGQDNAPPVATGGRYDALTRQLGQGKSIPAVGAVIRPALSLSAQEGT